MSRTKEKARLVVLISGSGTNLQAILDACRRGELSAEVAAVISDQPQAYGLVWAKEAGVPAIVKPKRKEQTRAQYDDELAQLCRSYQPDLIILAGWMRLLTRAFLDHFPMQVINLHPALPGAFPGTHAIQRAYEAYRRGEITHTGVMVHLVPDEGVDNGPLLAQEVVPIEPDDTPEALETRVHSVEHRLLPAAIQKYWVENG